MVRSTLPNSQQNVPTFVTGYELAMESVVTSLATGKGSVSVDSTDQLGSAPKRVVLPALLDQTEIDDEPWMLPNSRLQRWIGTLFVKRS